LGVTGFELDVRFPGQYRDAETGLFYNYFRDYDPQTGRHVQSDPIGLASGVNPYTYANLNPLRHSDPKGLIPGEIPLAEGELPHEPPHCKDNDCLCRCLEQQLGVETYAGTGLAISGLPTEPKRFVTSGSSPGTSVASNAASEVFRDARLSSRMWAPTLMHPAATTTSVARFVGRWVPGLGWGMLGVDAYQVYQCKRKCEDDQCKN